MDRQHFFILLFCFSIFGISGCVDDNSNGAVYEPEEFYIVSEECKTKGSTPIISGLGTYKTGKYVTVKAKSGSMISGQRTSGSGSISSTYESGGYACADINDIHGDWIVGAHIPDYTVAVKAGTGGTASGGGTVEKGGSVNISASPSSGYSFDGWSLTSGAGTFGSTSSSTTIFKPNSNSTVTANFKKNKSIKYVTLSYSAQLSYGDQYRFDASLSENVEHPNICVGMRIKVTYGVPGSFTYEDKDDTVEISTLNSTGYVYGNTKPYVYEISEPTVTDVHPTQWTGSDGTIYILQIPIVEPE